MLEKKGFNYTQTGARMLGRGVCKITSETTHKTVLSILAEENRRCGIYVLAEVISGGEEL